MGFYKVCFLKAQGCMMPTPTALHKFQICSAFFFLSGKGFKLCTGVRDSQVR
ncbi:UNVERIFIED_CONTAM: hypothetical protein FKN15_040766 [Acipenser sinensis]